MEGDEHADTDENGGVRRTRSTQDDESPTKYTDLGRTSRDDHGAARRNDSDPIPTQASMAAAIDAATETHPRPSHSSAARVRFSLEDERPALPLVDGEHQLERVQTAREASFRRIDMSLSSNAPPLAVLGHSIVTSPIEIEPPLPFSRAPPSATSGLSQTSHRSTNRGYSLRRALYTKSIHGSSEHDGSIIEMEPAGSSCRASGILGIAPSTERTKKGSTVVVVSPVKHDDLTLSAQPTKPCISSSVLPNYESRLQDQAARPGLIYKTRAFQKKAHQFIMGNKDIPPSKDGRRIDLDISRNTNLTDERTSKPYVGNIIRSCRYTLWNFFPRQLVAQFSKFANLYFLCVSIVQMIPSVSTTGRYTTIIPLSIFVGISMSKEGCDDLRKYRLDKEENNRDTYVLRVSHSASQTAGADKDTEHKHWVQTKWKEVEVGDVVKLDRDTAAPADLVLLHADGPNGVCYIETMALDGETNLKTKQPSPLLGKRCNTTVGLSNTRAHFVVEDPNLDLYNFEGKVQVGNETLPLTNNEIIYRDSILRNTQQALGMVIYSGEECKIRMNATKNPRVKAPALQAVVNRIVLLLVCFVVALALFNTVAYQIWREKVEEKSWYLINAGVAFFPILSSLILMFNSIIPLSLYISLEIVKLAQISLMNDIDMYDEASDTPMEPRTSAINEELGQVSYIFSDKTGTLTNNDMRFRKISVAGTAWLHDSDLLEEAAREADKVKLLHKKRIKGKQIDFRENNLSETMGAPRRSNATSLNENTTPTYDGVGRSDSFLPHWRTGRLKKMLHGSRTEEMLEYIQNKPHTVFARRARFFILSMALCHTCIPEKDADGQITFQAASPDELALVKAAQELGYLVVDRQSKSITIKTSPSWPDVDPVYETYEILDLIEFSSARKRVSIIVRMPDRRICVFCKGADSTLMQLLRLSGLALEKVNDVERRASKRKSMEAQQVMRRNGEKSKQTDSVTRTSGSIDPVSTSWIGRASITSRLPSIRDDMDHWLKDQETELDMTSIDHGGAHHSACPSIQMLSAGHSLALSDGTISFQKDSGLDLDESLVVNDTAVFERCFQHINDFATEGLRTLLYAYRYVDAEEYTAWKKLYLDATTSLENRQLMIERAGNEIERDFELLGATAIEDKLQKGVPEAIDKLRRANIKLWMLTGDKRETAINIGHSCQLIKDYSTTTILDHEVGEMDQRIAAAILNINNGTVAHSVIVIDGQTLALIDAELVVKDLFIDLAVLADSVICCRASPSQKASLVRSIRKKVKSSITLAIGDGANDIAMIQEAHVGIGIAGKEGLQAARTSDYSIAQFRFLLKLLLVHGRWNYIRVCKYTVGTFWKEMFFYLTQALYQRWAGYTGTSLYEPWSLTMFQPLFTSLPVVFIGIYEKDLAASTLLAVPELYSIGQRNGGFNIKVYLWWTFLAAADAMIVFFVMLGLYGQAIFTKDNGLYAMGDLAFTSCIIIISLKMQGLEMHNKTITAVIAIFFSVGAWFLWNLILSAVYNSNTIYDVKDGMLERFGRNLLWWLTVILGVSSVLLFELVVSCMRAAIRPTDVDIFQEYEQDDEARKRFEEAAAVVVRSPSCSGNSTSES